jgi:hypothetical protein
MADCCDDVVIKARYKHNGTGTTATMDEAGNKFANGIGVSIAVSKAISAKNDEDICRLIKTCKKLKKGTKGAVKTKIGKWITKLDKACTGSPVAVVGPTVIKGCTDETYEEYDPNATQHDAADCKTLKVVKVYGCTDSLAYNYNANATDDDGTCEFEEEVTLAYSYSFCNIKAGCDMVESSTKLVLNAGVNTYINKTQLEDTDTNVFHFEKQIVNQVALNLSESGGFFPWGSEGWYRTPVSNTVKTDLAKALTFAIMTTFKYEFFPYKKVTVYDGDSPIGEFIITKGSNSSEPSKRIQELTPANSANIVIARSTHNTPLRKNVNINGLNKALTDRGITQFKVIQNGDNQVLVNVEITEPKTNQTVQTDVNDGGGGINLTPESVIGLANILKEEPIGLAKILK